MIFNPYSIIWMNILDLLLANWPAPKTIKALTTCRQPGHSLPPYDQLNLGLHVGDVEEHVLANRALLQQELSLPNQPEWLNQTHSTRCIAIDDESSRDGDAAFTQDPERVLAIMTADCVPILICDREGREIAAIHAGWRGLLNGVIENTIQQLKSSPSELMAWIGPCICATCYEVGDEVREKFIENTPLAMKAFVPSPKDAGPRSSLHDARISDTHPTNQAKWLANLPRLAEDRLRLNQINAVYQSNICTFEQKDRFYSYRRSAQTGRIVSLIWFV